MKTVDPKSREMNKALAFRALLHQHPAWRRPDHGNPSPATWSRRRLHHAISCPGWHTHRSHADRRSDRQGSAVRPVCQTSQEDRQASPPHRLGSSRADQPRCRQLPAGPSLRHRHLHPADRSPHDNQSADTRPFAGNGPADAAAGPGHACPGLGSTAHPRKFDQQPPKHNRSIPALRSGCDHRHNRIADIPRGFGSSACHRSCARRSAPVASRSELSRPFDSLVLVIPGGDS